MRFRLQTQTFPCVFISRPHGYDENDASNSLKTQTFVYARSCDLVSSLVFSVEFVFVSYPCGREKRIENDRVVTILSFRFQ